MKAEFQYVGIRVTDLKKAIDFYTKVLGMKVTGRGKVEPTKGETVGLQSEGGTFTLELNYYPEDSPYYTTFVAGEALDHLAFKVEDLDKALEEAGKSGYRILAHVKTEGGEWAYIQAPDGIWIEVY